MKKSIFAILMALVLVFSLSPVDALAAGSSEMSPDIARIKESQELRIAIPAFDEVGFYEEGEDGELKGIDIELARDFAKSLGVEPVFVRIDGSFDNMTEALRNNEVDVIIGTFSRSYDRASYIDFSKSYLSLRFGVMVNKKAMVKAKIKSNPIPYMKENNVKISIMKGTSHVEMAKMLFPLATIVEVDSYAEADDMVKRGESFATFCSEPEFYSRYLQEPDYSIYVSTYIFNDVKDDFVIAVNRDDRQLKTYADLFIDTRRPLTFDDVKEKYNEAFK